MQIEQREDVNILERIAFSWSDPETYGFYQDWRAAKFRVADSAQNAGFIEIGDLGSPTDSEKFEIIRRCRETNLALYHAPPPAHQVDNLRGNLRHDLRRDLRAFAQAFDLHIAERHRSAGEQGIVALTETRAPKQAGYIPYSKRKMGWHTDGYYNAPTERISAMVLHCAQPAGAGGENHLLDPEIAFIRLWDENPDYVRALMHPRAMEIPADGDQRPVSTGPVFYGDAQTGALQMRYTARTRSITWRDDALTREATDFLRQILARPDPLAVSVKFTAGQGVLTNNALHDRTGFDADLSEQSKRVMYRVRFTNRVKGS